MRFILFLGLFFFISLKGNCQQAFSAGSFKIKGKIIDSLSRQPIGYATVTAFLKGSTQVAGGNITDEKGQFIIDNLAGGEYYVKFDFMGYRDKSQSGILVNSANPVVKLPDILLSTGAQTIHEVTVTASKNFMENHIDKLVYNVEKDITSQGGMATEVMKKLPQVNIDLDGNVELMGSTNVRVFINGKPSSMFDNNLAAALQSIPASMIKSIEVITSPGAQYDAQGTGGIINIILKENKAKGTNGNFSLSGGSRYENGSANIHVKRGSLDLSASLSGNMQLNTSTLNSYNRTSDSAGLNQNGYGSVQRNGYRAATGFDWAFTKKDDISGGLSYNNFGNVNNGSVTQNVITDYPIPVDTNTLRNTNNYFRYRSVDWNLNYKRKFENEGQELNLSYQESIANSVVDYQQVQYLNSGNYINYLYTGARGDNHQRPTDLYLTADYAHPFTKDIVLNTGLKGSFNHVGSNSGHYLLDTTFGNYYADLRQFDLFNYNRDIYAAYASITFAINKNYNMKIGLREEATHITYPDDSLAATTYFFLSPSGVISRTFKHNQTLKLSYSKRIQRPGFGQVNPFIDATDPANLSQGNPYLHPQKIDYLELQYYRFFEKGSNFMANLFYRFSNYDWEGYVTYYNSLPVGDTLYKNAGLSKTINAGTLQTGGLNLSGTIEATKKLEIRASTSLFEKYIQSDLQSANDQASFNYRFNTNIVYKFDKTLSAEFFYNYNSAHVEVQGKYPDYYYYNFAVRKQFLDNKASISFTTTNPFTHYTDQVSYIDGPNFSATSDRQYPNRVFTLSFNYKFGKIEYKEKKEEPAENTEQTENKDNS